MSDEFSKLALKSSKLISALCYYNLILSLIFGVSRSLFSLKN